MSEEKQNPQEVENQESPGQDKESQQNNPYEGLEKDELLKKLNDLESSLHEANRESKQRKLKLRDLEKKREEDEANALKEQEKWKELYEGLYEKTKDHEELVSFRDSYQEKQKTKLANLEKKLTDTERKELELIGDIDVDKKVDWIEYKLSHRGPSNDLDSTRSSVGGGTQKAHPKNMSDLAKLSTQEVREFKEKFPALYREALKNK